jgi:hypothetical protein
MRKHQGQGKKTSSKTPDGTPQKKNSIASDKLPNIHPMSSIQFKEMLEKRRFLVTNGN